MRRSTDELDLAWDLPNEWDGMRGIHNGLSVACVLDAIGFIPGTPVSSNA